MFEIEADVVEALVLRVDGEGLSVFVDGCRRLAIVDAVVEVAYGAMYLCVLG
jgi:hypothetical protein